MTRTDLSLARADLSWKFVYSKSLSGIPSFFKSVNMSVYGMITRMLDQVLRHSDAGSMYLSNFVTL